MSDILESETQTSVILCFVSMLFALRLCLCRIKPQGGNDSFLIPIMNMPWIYHGSASQLVTIKFKLYKPMTKQKSCMTKRHSKLVCVCVCEFFRFSCSFFQLSLFPISFNLFSYFVFLLYLNTSFILECKSINH